MVLLAGMGMPENEGAVDRLATWKVDGHDVRPKVIASTATVRRAQAQVFGFVQPPGSRVSTTGT